MDALYQLSYSGTMCIISHKLKNAYMSDKLLLMKLRITKKKLIILSVIGIITCAATTLLLIKLIKPHQEPIAPVSDNDPTELINEENQTLEPIIEVAPLPEVKPKNTGEYGYYIEVNRQQNVVMIYALDQAGAPSDIIKVFVASTGAAGSETIIGTFHISDRFEALYLVGDVWGRYAVRIEGRYYFHSVPYFSKGNGGVWNDLEYLEYNKLGEGASAGCVRLAVVDAKWIYDNIPAGTTVKIYDADDLPSGVIKPTATKIDENSPNRGWDPTDPSPENPWK